MVNTVSYLCMEVYYGAYDDVRVLVEFLNI